MDSNLQVRLAGVADAAGLARVQIHAWQNAYRGILPDQLLDTLDLADRTRRFAERFADPNYPSDREWLCARDDEIIGWLAWTPSRDADADPAWVAEVAAVYVHPSAWRVGAGALLMNHAQQHITSLATFSEITVWVLEDNPQARRFYERCGYRLDGTSRPSAARTSAAIKAYPDFSPIRDVRYRRSTSAT